MWPISRCVSGQGTSCPLTHLGLPVWAQGLVEDWADAIEQSRDALLFGSPQGFPMATARAQVRPPKGGRETGVACYTIVGHY